eukprot:s1996_g5.t1
MGKQSSSPDARPYQCEKHRWGRALQWNLGGQELNLLDMAALDADILFVQEIARRDEGWLCDDSEHFHWVQFRGPDLWRGVGVGIAIDKFDCIVGKVAVRRGIWILARLKGLGRVVLGTLHALTGVTNGRYQETALEYMRSCPSAWRQYPLLCGFDVNETPRWNRQPEEAEELGRVPLDHCSSNLNVIADQALGIGLLPIVPLTHQLDVATHYPRDETREGRQIDMMWSRALSTSRVCIDPARRHSIGSDQAVLWCDISVSKKPGRRWGNDSRPRWVTTDLPDVTIVDAEDVEKLARAHTAPRSTRAYVDPVEVKEAFLLARTSNDKQMWKKAHRARRKARQSWHASRLTAILNGDWTQYRARQRECCRKRGWWGKMLGDRTSEELTMEVRNHLVEKLSNDQLQDWDDLLQAQIDAVALDAVFAPFSLLDMRTALQEMKPSSAVGPDGISVGFLREMASHDTLAPQLLSLVNHITENLEMPPKWTDSFLALLAKVDEPTKPKELRPICVSSAFHKMVNKMVCARTMPSLRQGSRISGCGKGRQAADVIGALSRVRDITQEWRLPVLLCKLDISGAFDRLDRQSVVDFLKGRLANSDLKFELKYLIAQMFTFRLTGHVPGGVSIVVEPNVGIKQGAPESAELFGLVMDTLLTELTEHQKWKDIGDAIGDLDVDLIFYQDDIFILEDDLCKLGRRISVLKRSLRTAGLRLATEKTKIIASSSYKGPRSIKLGSDILAVAPQGESLRVLGLAFCLDGHPSQQARELLRRTPSAAAQRRVLLREKAAWERKYSLIGTLVASQFQWTAGAVHWSREDLLQANVLQLHTMRNSFGLHRVRGESWVSWNSRTMRQCRCWLAYHGLNRWSTTILTLQHTLSGHWARRIEHVGELQAPKPSLPMRTLLWRSTRWWRQQQSMSRTTSLRHKGHVFISNVERQLADAHGCDWSSLAGDREKWTLARSA